MKKLVCLLLAACVAALALAGCGGDKEEKENSSSLSEIPAAATPSPTPEPQKAKALRVTADSGLNVRAEASTDSEILGLADSGSRLALLVEEPKDGWYQIQYKGQTAYVSAEYAEVVEVSLEDITRLPAQEPGDPFSQALPPGLTPEDRQLLSWKYELELDHREMARRLGISPQACRARLSRLLRKCRDLMQPTGVKK